MIPSAKSLFGKLKPKGKGERGEFSTARTTDALFPTTDPAVDGEECLHDCETCTIKFPSKFSIDEEDKLYGFIKGWNTHLIVATGKTDWVRDVADEPGSIMEAVGRHGLGLANGKLMLSASNMPPPDEQSAAAGAAERPATVLVLPAFKYVDRVTQASVPALLDSFVGLIPTNTSPLTRQPAPPDATATMTTAGLAVRDCPHQYLILLCSQKTRDARCGQSAPLLRREFERHLHPLGLHRDLTDGRPGGVGIYFISHVGGHKYSANCMIYRRAGSPGAEVDGAEGEREGGATDGDTTAGEAAQCIWLARVRPEDCENIITYTVLQGKVVKPERQLRGGFDRAKGLTSW